MLKHGPIALIEGSLPVFFVAPRYAAAIRCPLRCATTSTRSGRAGEDHRHPEEETGRPSKAYAAHFFHIPETPTMLMPLLGPAADLRSRTRSS